MQFKIKPTTERFYNTNSNWGVYVFQTNDDIPHYEEGYDFDPFDTNPYSRSNAVKIGTLCGNMQKLTIGVTYNVTAEVEYNKKYKSWQYQPSMITSVVPKTHDEQVAYLKTQVTELQAKNILAIYPNVVDDVMNGKDIDYSVIHGIGEYTWNKIKKSIIDNYAMSDLLVYLQPMGITFKMLSKLLDTEPNPILLQQKIKDDPYVLTKIKGLGFKTVDTMALKLNPEIKVSQKRVVAFLNYYFTELGESTGDTVVSKTVIDNIISNDYPECTEIYNELIEHEKIGGLFLRIIGNDIGLARYHNAEMGVYNLLQAIDSADSSGKFDIDIDKGIETAERKQGFEFSDEQKECINSNCKHNVNLLTGKAGCVDCDTEYFNGREWKRIADYTDGERVLQYNDDGTAQLVYPLNYIKQKADYLWHFETKYGLDQCLSDKHECYYITSKGNLYHKPFKEIRMAHESKSKGFQGRFVTTFIYSGQGIDLSDDEIRLMVATFADGSFYYKQCQDQTYHKARFHIKKDRKKQRLIELAQKCECDYRTTNSVAEGYTDIYIQVPFRCKHFPTEWYNCNQHQLQIIADEIIYWDCNFKEKNCYSTTSKSDANFVQFVMTATGKRATIGCNDRKRQEYLTNGKIYIRKSPEYVVCWTERTLIGFCADNRPDHHKTQIVKYKTLDGYEYCFTVPSHKLVLRRNDKIFITGNCGKSTVLRAITEIYKNYSIACCALSAKAAQRIVETTGHEAMTIHRLLQFNPNMGWGFNANNPLPYDVIILDEASMVNIPLFKALLSAVQLGSKVILCGDDGQLPPIGYGNLFHDLLEYNQFHSFKLQQIHRQAAKSGIITDAAKIRNNENPLDKPATKVVTGELQDMTYMFRDNREGMRNLAIKLFLKAAEQDGVDNTIIITPCKQDRINSTFEINKIIQDKLLPNPETSIKFGNKEFRVGDKIMQTVNDYEMNVMNGETGYVTSIVDNNTMMVQFDNKSEIVYSRDNFKNIELAYAMTIHKCQGSGYKNVICIIDNTHYKLLDSCLLYTGLTRAIKKCLLIAEPSAFRQCIRNKASDRNTWLKKFFDIF